MNKPKKFLTNANGSRLKTEGDILKAISFNQESLMERFPGINRDGWRVITELEQKDAEALLCIELWKLLKELREALTAEGTPTWKAAALGMKVQDRIMRIKQPEDFQTLGAINRQGQRGRQSSDRLTLRVLRHLRASEITFDQAVIALSSAAADIEEIDEIEIYTWKNKAGFTFRKSKGEHEPAEEERYSITTLRKKKWPKAKAC